MMFEEKIAELNGRRRKGSYTVAEVQKILGISRPAVYALIEKNLFRTVMLDNQYQATPPPIETLPSEVKSNTNVEPEILLKLLTDPEMAQAFQSILSTYQAKITNNN